MKQPLVCRCALSASQQTARRQADILEAHLCHTGAKEKLGLRVHGLIVGSPEKKRADPAVLRSLCSHVLPSGKMEVGTAPAANRSSYSQSLPCPVHVKTLPDDARKGRQNTDFWL